MGWGVFYQPLFFSLRTVTMFNCSISITFMQFKLGAALQNQKVSQIDEYYLISEQKGNPWYPTSNIFPYETLATHEICSNLKFNLKF